MISLITPLISLLVLVSNVLFIVLIVWLFADRAFRVHVYRFVQTHILSIIFAISLSALIGSLLYSNIVGYPPCELCWIQRIFLYPQTLLAYLALRKRDMNMVGYLLPLSIIGAIVALYHSYIQWGGGFSVAPCVATGGECAKVFVLSYSYITIPFMSFSIFAYLIIASGIYYKALNSR